MKWLEREKLEEKVFDRMNDHPSGWRLVYTVNTKEQYSIGIINKSLNEQYWLKFPSPHSLRAIGFESTLNEGFEALGGPYFDINHGFRPIKISNSELEKMKKTGRLITSVMEKMQRAKGREPEPYDERKFGIRGPYPNFIIYDIGSISPAQRELEEKMQEEIDRLERRNTSYII